MTKIDQLISKFKEFKEELNKNVNMSYSGSPNGKMPASMGTSGAQGGMYRAEMDKNVVAPMTMQMAEAEKQDASGAGGAQDALIMSCGKDKMHIEKNGQWSLSQDGKNREANPKLKEHDLSSGGKRHMVKQEGTNECANPTQPHNKEEFKVMPMAPEKESKKEDVKGKPYTPSAVKKGEKQGNEAKGFDENKAPGRGTLGI